MQMKYFISIAFMQMKFFISIALLQVSILGQIKKYVCFRLHAPKN